MRKSSAIYAALLAFAASTIVALPASAAVLIATFTGTVDGVGLGGQGFDIPVAVGDSATINFSYDLSQPGIIRAETSTQDLAIGTNLVLSADYNINGKSFLQNVALGNFKVSLLGQTTSYVFNLDGNTTSAQLAFRSETWPVNLATPVSFTSAPGIMGNGEFELDDAIGANTVDFSFDSFQISAVPEPATWGLFILGFGGIGAALRRQRSRESARFS